MKKSSNFKKQATITLISVFRKDEKKTLANKNAYE